MSRASMTLTEMGAQEVYTVRLSSEPRGFLKVVMKYEPSDFILFVSPSVLAFDSSNWNQTFDVIVQVAVILLHGGCISVSLRGVSNLLLELPLLVS